MEFKPGPSVGADTATASDAVTLSGSSATRSKYPSDSAFLPAGTFLASRYEIVELLGEGGMGAVYKARDRELDRIVALKVIRPDLAGHEWILQRFKQELILARQITHRNVIRIYDLGEAAGMKFITMEYLEGETLKTILQREGKLAPPEAAKMVRQVSQGLVAAHAEGVIHRDLKPGNIIRDKQGRIVVMDFGLAHSAETPRAAATAVGNDPTHTQIQAYNSQPGTLVGTPAYMAPEQASGQEADARSDIFALGIIFFELLTARTPFNAAPPSETLSNRIREKPKSLGEVGAKVPHGLARIVERSLDTNPVARYQTATELLADLDQYLAPFLRKAWKWMAVAAVLLLVGTEFMVQQRVTHRTAPQHAPMSVLVADFKNQTGDSIFDSTLEPAMGGALEGASFVSAYNRGQALKIAAQLSPGTTSLDETRARLVAQREGINVIVVGSIARQGNRYSFECKAIDAVSGNTIIDSTSSAANKDGVLRAANTLAARLRTALGDATPASAKIAQGETFTTGSLEAAREYGDAQSSLWTGKMDDAIQHYLKAVDLDPNMGRAYTGLAVVYLNKKQPQEAKKYFELALSKIDRMSDREKYRTRGVYYASLGNTDKAIEELTQLVEQYPGDSAGMANLALSYFFRRDMKRALEFGQRAVQISPKNVIQRNNVGLYAMYAGDFDAAIREQQAVLQMNPSFALAYVGTALPQLAEGRNAEAEQTYHRLEQVNPQGASQANMGLADLALYEGRASDAIQILNKGITTDLQNKDADGAATKFAALGEAYLLQGRAVEARGAAAKALSSSSDDGILFSAARLYLGAGDFKQSLVLARRLAAKIEPDPQAYAKVMEGEIALEQKNPQEALQLFQQARQIADTWSGRFDSGRAYLEAGAFAEADSEFETCLKRRGEATALFLEEVPSYHLFPPVYYYLGRAQQGLKSPAATDSFKTFLTMKTKGIDPLVADARRRIESR